MIGIPQEVADLRKKGLSRDFKPAHRVTSGTSVTSVAPTHSFLVCAAQRRKVFSPQVLSRYPVRPRALRCCGPCYAGGRGRRECPDSLLHEQLLLQVSRVGRA
jgi:hypothetical protein